MATSLKMSYEMSTSFVPGLWDAITLVIANDAAQFQLIEETRPVSTTAPDVFVAPRRGTDPVPAQPVARQLTPDSIEDCATEQVTEERHAYRFVPT
ncbi:MAG: hypothetical protein WCI20_08890, partial [bacterium]